MILVVHCCLLPLSAPSGKITPIIFRTLEVVIIINRYPVNLSSTILDARMPTQGQVHPPLTLPGGLLVGAVLVAQDSLVAATQAQSVTLHSISEHQFVKSERKC